MFVLHPPPIHVWAWIVGMCLVDIVGASFTGQPRFCTNAVRPKLTSYYNVTASPTFSQALSPPDTDECTDSIAKSGVYLYKGNIDATVERLTNWGITQKAR